MNESLEILVEHPFRGERLDVFLAQHLPEESRSYLQSLIKQGHVTLQGKKVRCGEKISSGDLIVVQKIQKQALAKAFPEEIPLRTRVELE